MTSTRGEGFAVSTAPGDFFKQECGGYTGHVFTGSKSLAKHIGLRPKSRTPFMNAQIECRLLAYDLYAGSRKHNPSSEQSKN